MNDLGIDELFECRHENDQVIFDLHPAVRDMRADELLVRMRLEIENLENYLKTATGDLPPSPHAYELTRA